jgi:hypothetical protein
VAPAPGTNLPSYTMEVDTGHNNNIQQMKVVNAQVFTGQFHDKTTVTLAETVN